MRWSFPIVDTILPKVFPVATVGSPVVAEDKVHRKIRAVSFGNM